MLFRSLVIEHNLDVIRAADWVIDLGPEGGDAGGEVLCAGTPVTIMAHAGSHTGQALREYDQTLHAALAEHIESADVHRVYLAGPMMRALWDILPEARRGAYAESAQDLAPLVAQDVRPGDVAMVKGSNGSKASVVARALAALGYSARESA